MSGKRSIGPEGESGKSSAAGAPTGDGSGSGTTPTTSSPPSNVLPFEASSRDTAGPHTERRLRQLFWRWLTQDGKLTARDADGHKELISRMNLPVITAHLHLEEHERASVKLSRMEIDDLVAHANRKKQPGVVWILFSNGKAACISAHMANSAPRDAIKDAYDVPIGWLSSWAVVFSSPS